MTRFHGLKPGLDLTSKLPQKLVVLLPPRNRLVSLQPLPAIARGDALTVVVAEFPKRTVVAVDAFDEPGLAGELRLNQAQRAADGFHASPPTRMLRFEPPLCFLVMVTRTLCDITAANNTGLG